jgi:hypothetical protein
MTHRYEITYESSTSSGSVLILAESDEEALAKFDENHTLHGDTPPTRWVSARWAVE